MPIELTCPCGVRLRTSDANAGKKGKCPKCGRVMAAPSIEPVVAPPPPPPPAPEPVSASDDLFGDLGFGSTPEPEPEPTPAAEPATDAMSLDDLLASLPATEETTAPFDDEPEPEPTAEQKTSLEDLLASIGEAAPSSATPAPEAPAPAPGAAPPAGEGDLLGDLFGDVAALAPAEAEAELAPEFAAAEVAPPAEPPPTDATAAPAEPAPPDLFGDLFADLAEGAAEEAADTPVLEIAVGASAVEAAADAVGAASAAVAAGAAVAAAATAAALAPTPPEPPAPEGPVALEPWKLAASWQAPAGVTALSFSPHGKRLAVGGDDHKVRLWDLASGSLLATLTEHNKPVTCVAWAPRGEQLASGCGGSGDLEETKVVLWDANTKKRITSFRAHHKTINTLVFSRDGDLLVTGGDCDENAASPTLVYWDLHGKQRQAMRVADDSPVRQVVLCPRADQVAAAAWQTITLWDLSEGEKLVTVNSGSWDQFQSVALTPDGLVVAGGCFEYIRLWDLAASRTVAHLTGYNGNVHSVSFSPDGVRIAGVSTPESQWDPSEVRLWNVATHEELCCLDLPSPRVTCLAFAPLGSTLVTGHDDGTVAVWVPA